MKSEYRGCSGLVTVPCFLLRFRFVIHADDSNDIGTFHMHVFYEKIIQGFEIVIIVQELIGQRVIRIFELLAASGITHVGMEDASQHRIRDFLIVELFLTNEIHKRDDFVIEYLLEGFMTKAEIFFWGLRYLEVLLPLIDKHF